MGGPEKRKSFEAGGRTRPVPPQICHHTLHTGALYQKVAPKQASFIFMSVSV